MLAFQKKSNDGDSIEYSILDEDFNGFGPAGGIVFTTSKTKNPPFNRDLYDFWGNYKADYQGNPSNADNHVLRRPTTMSAKHTDAWALTSVETSMGAEFKINYEPNKIDEIVLDKHRILNLKNFDHISGSRFRADVIETDFLRNLPVNGPADPVVMHFVGYNAIGELSDAPSYFNLVNIGNKHIEFEPASGNTLSSDLTSYLDNCNGTTCKLNGYCVFTTPNPDFIDVYGDGRE